MNEIELKKRTKQFALRVIRLIAALPKTVEGRAIANQLVRSGTSVGANYRAACRGRSKPEFVAKLGTVEEEADESAFWMELIIEGQLMKPKQVELLLQEANELLAIMVSSRKSASSGGSAQIKNQKSQIKNPSPVRAAWDGRAPETPRRRGRTPPL